MSLTNWSCCALFFAAFSVIKGESTRSEVEVSDDLIQRAGNGDPAALSELYDQYVNKIYAYIYRRVGQADLAEDLTAQVFMRMLEAVRSGQAWRSSFSGWLYRIAHNLVIDHYRRRQRATFIEFDDAPPLKASSGDPVRSAESLSDSERLRAALSQLTDEQSQVITLRFLDECSIAEAATLMNKTEGAIKALQYRAVIALRRVIQP